MARCGWCFQTDLHCEPGGDGLLDPHTMPGGRKRCKRQDNPSMVLVRHQNEMGAQTEEKTSTEKQFDRMYQVELGNRRTDKQKSAADKKSKVRAQSVVVSRSR